jgi:hypothetical protein
MGGCGTFAAGNNVAYTYETVGTIDGIKVLRGIEGSGKHHLPEEAHSSSAYIKLNNDGSFNMMHIYDTDHYLKLEIAYHREPNIDPSGKKDSSYPRISWRVIPIEKLNICAVLFLNCK